MIRVVIIGVGPAFERLADQAAEAVRRHTGIEPVVIRRTPTGHPAVAKLHLLDLFPGDTVAFFDADTRIVRPWDLSPFENLQWFAAVGDLPSEALRRDCEHYQLEPARYVNTGVWIAGPVCAPVLREAAAIVAAPEYRTAFRFEQTALNVALQRSGVGLQLLDGRYNAICSPSKLPPDDAVVLHCAGACLHGPHRVIFEKAILDAETATP